VLFVALGWSLHCDGNDRPAVARDERGVVVEYLAAEKGFGRLSMEQGLYPWLRTQGQKTEWRITLASNIESMGFYGRLGFVYGTCLYPVEIQPPARDLPRLDDKSITAIYHGSSAIDALASPDARAAVDLFIAVIRQLHAHALGLGISGREATTPSARTPPLLTSRRSRWFRGINLGFVMHFTVSASL
jgi:hypothetical protein